MGYSLNTFSCVLQLNSAYSLSFRSNKIKKRKKAFHNLIWGANISLKCLSVETCWSTKTLSHIAFSLNQTKEPLLEVQILNLENNFFEQIIENYITNNISTLFARLSGVQFSTYLLTSDLCYSYLYLFLNLEYCNEIHNNLLNI